MFYWYLKLCFKEEGARDSNGTEDSFSKMRVSFSCEMSFKTLGIRTCSTQKNICSSLLYQKCRCSRCNVLAISTLKLLELWESVFRILVLTVLHDFKSNQKRRFSHIRLLFLRRGLALFPCCSLSNSGFHFLSYLSFKLRGNFHDHVQSVWSYET